MRKRLFTLLVLLLVPISALSQALHADMSESEAKVLSKEISNTLGRNPKMFLHYKDQSASKVRLLETKVIPASQSIELHLNANAIYIAIREPLLREWEVMVRDTLSHYLKRDFDDANVEFLYNRMPLEDFIPNAYRKELERDKERDGRAYSGIPLITRENQELYTKGFNGAHIAMWPSHGWYYEAHEDTVRWQFQRPALYRTIEDLHTFQYVERYLAPMVESAGGIIISPRERSTQREEVVVDNSAAKILSGNWVVQSGGYRHIRALDGENPHELGAYLLCENGGEIEYSTPITKAGRYGITLSYASLPNSSRRVRVDVNHSGGQTTIYLNQRMGGSTWIHIGEWDFDTTASVKISGEGTITADAVRFGGGMGSVKRDDATSGMPRWSEAARYYLQFSGVPKDIYAVGEKEAKEQPPKRDRNVDSLDYIDDYKSRGMWANWLVEERNIPLDMAVALHSNAGITDTTFGTLTIHYTEKGKGELRDGSSKFTSRDLSDMVQSQILENIRARHLSEWAARSLFDRQYAEVSRPVVPSTIIEMFSHQNYNDMELATTPQFRFEMARAIYIGMLKYLAQRYNRSYVVQPLPLRSFDMSMSGGGVRLSWQAAIDSLESSAKPDYYRIYCRVGERGEFMAIGTTMDNYYDIGITQDSTIRSYRVTAVNRGGESFPSETLSCGFTGELNFIDVVRNECQEFSSKVPYIYDYSYTGEVYDNDPKSEFVDNRNPGWGASHYQLQTIGRRGETLDNTLPQGAEILRGGGSYISRGSGRNHWAPIKKSL